MAMTFELFLLCLAVGVAVGVMSAMFGVGGGVIMVPFIVLVFDQTQQVAEGTSLLVVVPTAIVGVVAHHRRGLIDADLVVPVALTGTVGAFLGARLALALHPGVLQNIFGVFTIFVAFKLLSDSRADKSDAGDAA
ncbi:MAG: sulfite exporter TauE/SafE family protein [Actinomycetota bacterium]